MTACPCAQQLVAGARARAPDATTASPTSEIGRIFEHVPVATHNQRGLGTLHIGCPEDCDDRDRRPDAAGDRRGVDVLGDLRADEALGRGRGRREGPPPPALRRGLRARDDPRRHRRGSPSSATSTSSRPARRTSRRSTSTTSWPSASACWASCATSCARRAPPASHVDARVARRRRRAELGAPQARRRSRSR